MTVRLRGSGTDDETDLAPATYRRTESWVAVGLWALLVVTAIRWGPSLLTEDAKVRAPPVMGRWDWHLSPAVTAPLALAAVTVACGPRWAATLSWPRLICATGAASAAWAAALAATEGWHRVTYPLSTDHEYLAVVDQIEGPGSFLQTFVERLDSYPIHVQGHPPGMPLLLWVMDRIGMGGTGWAAALVLAGAGLATAATLVTARSVAGEPMARRAAPFMVVAPAAVWLGTSTDAFFTGVIALGIALLVAGNHPTLHVAGGAVLGFALFLTYGAVPLLVIPAGVWLYRRNLVPLLWAALGAAVVTAGFWAGGFWWFDGLDATREAYEAGVSQYRPYRVFTPLLNPAALALATGPAVAAGVGAWWARRRSLALGTWLLPALGLAAVTMANVSGLSKAEVERIWLPFVPWLLLATMWLPRRRLWVGVQAAVAILIQLALRSPW